MGIVDDLLSRGQRLKTERANWDKVWSDIADFCLPDHARFTQGTAAANAYDIMADAPSSVARGRVRFDDTALRAIDRLASGMESLVTPQSDKWHGLKVTDPLAEEETDEEAEYFERFRDYMFDVRYNARAGFIGAHQKALRSAIALGTGVTFVEECLGAEARRTPALWRYLPLSECYLAVNAQGEPDTVYREFTLSARQARQKFGEKLHDNIARAADSPREMDRRFTFWHAVQRREELGSRDETDGTLTDGSVGARSAPFASYYVDQDNHALIGDSGFFEFPFDVYYWQPVENGPYAQSPVMMAMSEIRGLNAIRKTSLRGFQQYFDPPMASSHDGMTNRPNLNPGKMNYNAIDANGRPRIQPIMTMQRPDFVQEIIQAERTSVNDSLYVTLFQILINNPQMTATEAMIRANEKGELLGPAGGKIQQAMARDVERLGGILARAGVLSAGSPLEPPKSLRDRDFGARFTSPLDRLRRSAEGIGIQRTMETVMPLVQIKPEVLDNFDVDEIARVTAEINGAPRKILMRVEERDAKRGQDQQMKSAQTALEMAKTGSEVAKNAVPPLGQLSEMMRANGGAPPQVTGLLENLADRASAAGQGGSGQGGAAEPGGPAGPDGSGGQGRPVQTDLGQAGSAGPAVQAAPAEAAPPSRGAGQSFAQAIVARKRDAASKAASAARPGARP